MLEDQICPECHKLLPFTEFMGQTKRKGRYAIMDICCACSDKLYGIIRKDYSTLEAQIEGDVYRHNKRAKDMGLIADLTVQQWADILRQSNGYCEYCHTFAGIEHLVLDHKVPLVHNGGTTHSNVAPACKDCNWSKGSKPLEQWLNWLVLRGKEKQKNIPESERTTWASFIKHMLAYTAQV